MYSGINQMSDDMNLQPGQTPVADTTANIDDLPSAENAAENRVDEPDAPGESSENVSDSNEPKNDNKKAKKNAKKEGAKQRKSKTAPKNAQPETEKKKKRKKDKELKADENTSPAVILPGEQHFQPDRRKKNRILILASVLLFVLTVGIQYAVSNLLTTPKEGELINWMFVTGKSNDEVSGATSFFQAETRNRVSKPVTNRYFYGKYTVEGSDALRMLRVTGLYSPLKIVANGTEIYNNGYGEKKVVGNSYNEVLLPPNAEDVVLEVFIYYPFAFHFSSYLTPMESTSAFSISTIGDNFSIQLCLLAVLAGLLMLVSVFALMFRSKDVVTIVCLSMVVTLTGISMLLQMISMKSAMLGSYLVLSISQLLGAMAMAFSILVIHLMMRQKRSYLTLMIFLMPLASAAFFVPNTVVMSAGGILSAVAAIAAGVILMLELYDIPNLNILYSPVIRVVSIYLIIVFAFNQTVFSCGLLSMSTGLSAFAMIVFSIMVFFIYARKVAQKRLESFSDYRQRSEISSIFSAVSEIVSIPSGMTSSKDYAVSICERTTKFLISSELLIVPDDLICCAAIKEENGFTEIYNYQDRAAENYDYNEIYEHLSGPSGGLTIGSGFIEMKFGTPETVEVVFIFDNTYYNENSDFREFMETLFRSTSIFLERFSKNFENTENIEHIYMNLASLAESRCSGTEKHLIDVYRMSKIIAEKMGFDEEAELIGKAAILHDVGKITIPSEILDKNSPLTAEETTIMRQHVITGYNILLGVKGEFFDIARSVVLEHHENWDGSGYLGKKGEEISIYARIVKIADVFDALVSKRSYKARWSYEQALTYIMERSGIEFDPNVVRTFMSCGMELIEIKEEGFSDQLKSEAAGVTA